jgi:hypothetical protein
MEDSMSKRIVVLSAIGCLGLGLTFAFAQRPKSLRKDAAKIARATKVFINIKEPPNPSLPKPEDIQEELHRKFLEKPNEGTRTSVSPQASGKVLALHQAVAAAFEKENPSPPGRAERFAWLGDDPSIRQRGWRVGIISVNPVRGGWTAEVAVSPLIDQIHAGKEVFTGDRVYESYFYDGKSVQFLSRREPPIQTRSIAID